ncbi:exo-alpha-sialidase [Myxococcus sp. AM009]|uniref:WD40/YVTN/BNR-like repeat-containing protein n=1 Tax=unclassified Myxococcus TaxID=2648731 RepID=UPI0015950E0A|nr:MULTISPECIES: exo-alpha-sialidase [unclassified Myxococcus]NVI98584.1 exo-alpha-sialidase [Myxococcus sp. AM009]NVJ15208.1 exo-alpha-sialidase [Myxococcus sp. AM010]
MTGLAGAMLAVVVAASGSALVPVSGGNALTLPAQRHIVRIETGSNRPPTWLVAIQHGGVDGKGLVLYRSEDALQTLRRVGDIQPDAAHTDRAELLVVGMDVALVYSYEGPQLAASSQHDVYFQWWRHQPGANTWAPEPAVRVFNADASTAYSRALLARDAQGRLWVQAFRLDLDGGATAVVSVSTNGGQHFGSVQPLDKVRRRGGGRLLSVGTKLVFLYGMHDGWEPARMRIRSESDPLGTWGPVRQAFSDGIYHGAALSAVADGKGGMHLVYKDELEKLYYRHFDGSSFGSRVLVEGSSDWATQPAITRIGDTLYVFYNRVRALNANYELRVRTVDEDGALGSAVTLDGDATFKGYLNAVDVLPEGSGEVPCLYGEAVDAGSWGSVSRVSLVLDDAPPPEPEPGPGPFVLELVRSHSTHELLAVDGAGTLYGIPAGGPRSRLMASTDGGHTFSARGQRGGNLWTVAAMDEGTLLAVASHSGEYVLQRSTDGGMTWENPLRLGTYRARGPQSFARLGSTWFFLEYQSFTSAAVPIRLWATTDGGATWSVRSTFTAHRHGYTLVADPATGTLWATLGSSEAQAAVRRSSDGGRTWTSLLRGYGANAVAGVAQPGGALLLGQSTLFEPEHPKLLRLSPDGTVRSLLELPGPAYSLTAVPGGGWVMGTAWSVAGDVHASGDVFARLFISADGVTWQESRRYERMSGADLTRADVWGALPSGELVVRVEDASGFGSAGVGFQVLRVKR